MDDLSGQEFNGYRLREKIGVGGFGTVYRAFQHTLPREVAVKIIHPWLAHDPAFIKRFEIEAYLIARLEHPYIVPIYDYHSDQTGAYIVLRWFGGKSLRDNIKTAPLAPERVAQLLPQVCSALAFAHRHKVIHRDIKPDNILLDDGGNAFLTDFNIAKDLSISRSDTPVGDVMGTPDYLAPEQFLGDPPTPQSDIYSLGLVIYELLTGALPFGKLPPHEIAQKRINESLPLLQQHRPDLPKSLNEVLQWATQRNPYNRCADALSLAEAYQLAVDSTQSTAQVNVQPATPSLSEIGPTPIITPILVSDLKARFYQKAELIVEKPRRLIGRDAVLTRVHQLLDENERILLCGMGGMGKTSLAATIADQRIAEGKGPVIWLEAGIESADILLEAIARTFDQQAAIARVTGDERITAIRELLLDKKALLVLDNLWNERALFHLQKAIPPSLPLLVTSRHMMPLDGMVVEVGQLDAASAHQLLAHHARRDLTNTLALCDKLGNHPFALEIAGKRLKVDSHLNPAQLLESIADAPHDLKLPQNFADVGREGIKDLLDDSINELPPDSRAAFQAMGSLFAPQATDDLFALVMGSEPEPKLADLQQRGLIERLPKAERRPAHYRLHDLTYSYARVLFVNAGRNHQPVIEAAKRYVTAHAEDYDELEFEQANVLGAANAAKRINNNDALIHIIKVLAVDGEYFAARGHAGQSLELLKAAIDAAQAAEQLEVAHRLYGKLGDYYRNFLGDYDKALEAYKEALELAPNPNRRAILLAVIGYVRFLQIADDADHYFARAESLAKQNEDDAALSMILQYQGLQALKKHDFEKGRQLSDDASKIAAHLNLYAIQFFSLLNRGGCEKELGLLDQALLTHKEIYQLALEQNNNIWMAHALRDMGEDYHDLGDRNQAQKSLDDALQLWQQSGATADATDLIKFMQDKNYVVLP